MTVRSERERIEVTLTSEHDIGVPELLERGIEERDRPTRRAVVTLVVGVGFAGLVLGWLLGRASVDRVVEAPIATTAPDIDDATERGTAEPEPADAAPATTPAVVPIPPVTPSLGDASPLATSVVPMPALLAGQPVEIVAYGNGRQLLRLDLSRGRLRSQEIQRHAFGRPRLVVGDEWVLLPSPDGDSPSLVVDVDGVVSEVDLGADRRVIGAVGDEIWLSTPELGVDGSGPAESTTLDGQTSGSIVLQAAPVGFDPRGGFVVTDDGGWYRVMPKAVAQLTTGELIALGTDVAVARECDAELRCGVVVIDRTTGQRRSIQPTGSRSGDADLALIGTGTVDEDSSHALVHLTNPAGGTGGQPMLAIVDLASGAVTELDEVQDIDEATWTPDGRFALYNRGGRLMAADVTTGTKIRVSDDLIAIDEFAIRPPLPDDGL